MRISISAKVFFVLLLAVLVFALGLYTYLSAYLKHQILEEKKSDFRTTFVVLNETIAHLWRNQETMRIQALFARLRAQPELKVIYVLDNNKVVVGSTKATTIGLPITQVLSPEPLSYFLQSISENRELPDAHAQVYEDSEGIYSFSRLVRQNTAPDLVVVNDDGYLLICAETESLLSEINMVVVEIFFHQMLYVFIVGSFISLYFNKTMGGRIRKIELAANSFFGSGKKWDLSVGGSDEISALADTMGRSMIRIEKQYQHIVERERYLSTLLDSIGDGVIAVDISGHVLRMNAAAEDITGWRSKEAKGETLNTVVQLFDAVTREAVELHEPGSLVVDQVFLSNSNATLVTKLGKELNIMASVSTTHDEKDRVNGLVLVIRDISLMTKIERTFDGTARAVAIEAGETFFENIALQLYQLFRTKYVLIGLIDQAQPDHLATAAVCENGALVENMTYEMEGSPCEFVVGKQICLYPDSIQALFPDDLWLKENDVESYIGAPIFSTEGKPVGVISMLHDKSMEEESYIKEALRIFAERVATEIERSLAHKKLVNAQRRLEQHIRLTPVGVIEWDVDSKVVQWNPAAASIFGFSKEEALGKTFGFLSVPESMDEAMEVWLSLLKQGKSIKLASSNVDRIGNHLQCDWYHTCLVDDAKKTVGVASMVLNVTAEKNALSKLLQKEFELREILDSMVDGVITIDEHGVAKTFNHAAENLFGYTAQEVLHHNIKMLMTEADSPHHDNYLLRYYETGEASVIGEGREVVGKRKDGTTFPIRLAVSELPRGVDGERRFIGCCQDLTYQKQQDEQIRRTQKMESLGKLTGGVAHDFNNILGVVSGYSELLTQQLDEESKFFKFASEIHRASERGAKLTRRMLAFSRNQFHQVARVSLNKVLLAERDLIEKTLTPSIEVLLELADDLFPVEIDASDLEDAVLNLAINAMHAMEGKGSLYIKTKNLHLDAVDAGALDLEAGDYALLQVRDTGSGISAEYISVIFDPFFTTKKEKGNGLGLSQVYGFVKRSRGAITVQSALGAGACFQLYFPSVNSESVVESKLAQLASPVLEGNETILVVDDEPALQVLVAEMLRPHGYQVVCASNAREALVFLERQRIDLLFSDVIMPDMDGYELAAVAMKKYPDLKVQMTSGFYSRDVQREPHIKQLEQNLIQKPYNEKTVLTRLRVLLDSR